MKITGIRTHHLLSRLSEREAVMTSQGVYATREVTLVQILTDEGKIGVGESLGTPSIVIPIIQNVLKPLLLGKDPTETGRLWALMLRGSSFRSQTGVTVEALSAVDIALWDLKGKILGCAIHNLLGGAFRDKIPAYATGLYHNSPEALEEEALRHLDNGFKAVKMKIGYSGGMRQDLAQIDRVRRTIGDGIQLMLDANMKYDLAAAVQLVKELCGSNISWIEEPLKAVGPHHDLEGYVELKSKSSVPIAWGEGEYLLSGLRDFLVRRAIDIVQPDVCRCGGITECRRIADAAGLFGIQYAPHFWTTGVGLAATLQVAAATAGNFLICEFDQSPNPLREGLLRRPLNLRDGSLPVPSGPGLGIELDDDKIDAFSIRVEE